MYRRIHDSLTVKKIVKKINVANELQIRDVDTWSPYCDNNHIWYGLYQNNNYHGLALIRKITNELAEVHIAIEKEVRGKLTFPFSQEIESEMRDMGIKHCVGFTKNPRAVELGKKLGYTLNKNYGDVTMMDKTL